MTLLCGIAALLAQPRSLPSVKTNQPPRIDGDLSDAVWQLAPVATDFIQNFPNVGKQASQRTEVRVVYDNTAIYIGAYLYDDPALIRRQITARDEEQLKDLDYFSVFFDTYNDHQNGFQFLATSSNVQTDARLAPNLTLGYGEYGDKTWDAVWDSKVSIKEDGWVVEMKIPYISLRFSKNARQDWGIQFMRSVRRNNETTFWNPVDPNVNGFVNQFGLLKDIIDIKPPLRLSFSPYVSTGYRRAPENTGFSEEWLKSGGMDVKYGINESFTLDATLVPDFGQVISDNVVNNLTPYEVRFDEYRPFFTEGTEIFNKSGLFYSRRVGATPSGYYAVKDMVDADPNLEIVKNPGRTQLYNAIKFSGRTPAKLGIGFFNAVGAPMYATIRDKSTGDKTKILTEPLTNYNILVLDQALRGRSYITFTNTNVIREGQARDANVTGLDFSFYDKKNIFNIRGYGHYSKIFSTNSTEGYNTQLRLGKVSGRWQYYAQNLIRSLNYNPTDLGYLQTANQHINQASIGYYQYEPTRSFLNYNYTLTAVYRRLYRPDVFNDLTVEATSFWYLRNFWDISLRVGYLPDQHDYFVIGRPFDQYARRPQYGYAGLSGSTDSRKRLYFQYDVLAADFFKNPEKEYYILSGGVRYRFSNKLTIDLNHRFETETDYIVSGGRDGMGQPRMAFVDFKDVTSILSGIYNFTPRINLTLRVRHYWSNVKYKRIAYIDAKGYPQSPAALSGLDNVNFFNTDAFLTWDFRYGSRLILGYKSWLGDDQTYSIDGNAYKRYLSNFGKTFDLSHGTELTVRFIYFLDYNQLKRSK
ncbi:MAG: carbohydrate binding family 9 domain-containing protein [Chitinophagaceae bacterium]|jgi:hypothetical protein|nr:carbohydrate binding family 9 domain-containing protein [Chitinophagaceae bacterium]